MARTDEYKTDGGAYEKLSDALSSIDQLLEEVKRVNEERETVPEKQRSFRNVIAELQTEVDACITELRKRFAELDLDPLYIYTTEGISLTTYTRNIKFLHPEYQHVWLTDSNGENVAANLTPFIDYGLKYDYEDQRLYVTNLVMNPKLNLPGFKTSLKAAHVDLEILKQDAKRVEVVNANGDAAHKKLSETLKAYCESHDIDLEIGEEIVPVMASEAERAAQKKEAAEQKAKQEAQRKAEAEALAAQKKAEEERAARKKAEEERAAKRKAEEEAFAAKMKAEAEAMEAKRKAEEKRAARKKAEEERAARKKAEEEQTRIKAEQQRVARIKAEQERAARIRAEEEAMAAKVRAEEEARIRMQEALRTSTPPLPRSYVSVPPPYPPAPSRPPASSSVAPPMPPPAIKRP